MARNKNSKTRPQSKRPRLFTWVLIVIILGLTAFIGFVVYWVSQNTAFLSGKLTSADLNKNNQNTSSEPLQLVAQTVGLKTLYAPPGFKISEYVTGVKGARFFSFGPDDTMYIGTNTGDSIYAVSDTNGDGVADQKKLIDSKLNTPHSLFYYKGDLYLGEQDRVSVYRGISADGSYQTKQVLVDNLPSGNRLTGGGHTTRTVVVGPDEKLYVSIGSSCNVCIENDQRRATIMRYNLDGSGGEIYSSGLRNTVGFEFNDGKLWGLDMGRDQIGDDIPPDEVNIIKQGANYGWPYCYGDRANNPEFSDKQEYCKANTVAPVLGLQAHSAPLGIAFENQAAKQSWPRVYQNGFFAALHGSWNRTVPTGYKVIWVDTKSNPMKAYNFITGWLDGSGAWGRPVGIGFDSKGNMYVSDDKQNLVYKVTYSQP